MPKSEKPSQSNPQPGTQTGKQTKPQSGKPQPKGS